MSRETKRRNIGYRTLTCGGLEVFGTKDCHYDEEKSRMVCQCTKAVSHNYVLWHAIAQVNPLK